MAVNVSDIDGHALFIEPVSPGDMVSVRYTHSVEKTPVNETYAVCSNRSLSLAFATFQSGGAGLPSDASYNITSENGSFVIKDFNRTYDSVIYGTGNISRHTISIHGNEYDMYEILRTSGNNKFIMGIKDESPINIIISRL